MIERIDTMTEAPTVGRWYLVRALTYDRFGRGAMAWPIIGPKHRDAEFFHFDRDHYHLDVRFLTARHLRQIGIHHSRGPLGWAFSQPCQDTNGRRMPDPELKRMQCRRAHAEYPYGDMMPVIELNEHFQGKSALRGKRGWVCPHRKVDLGNQAPDALGVITCPLHGLRIDAASGVCVGRAEPSQ